MARALIQATLAELDAPVDRETAELLTTELVANAVQHTAGDEPIELVVELVSAGWQVEVRDADPTVPGDTGPLSTLDRHGVPRRRGAVEPRCRGDWREVAEGGRGLLLIRTLSADSGYRSTPHGKAVWFTLPPVQKKPDARP